MMIKSRTLKWLLLLPLLVSAIDATEVAVNTQNGEMFVLDVHPDETLHDLEERVIALLDGSFSSVLIEVPSKKSNVIEFGTLASHGQGGYLGYPREYFVEVTPVEKADIHYIVTSLANRSMISLAFIKGELEDAGDRIDHLHPLRFLMTVFTDEELKVGIRNIRGNGWVWGHFFGGLKECLSTEASIGNIRDDYIQDFAQRVEIDINLIYSSIQRHNWDEFVDLLITHIPRKGDHDRYDH